MADKVVPWSLRGREEKIWIGRRSGLGVRRKDWPETRRLTADGNDYSISFIEDPDGYEVVERGTIKVGGMI